MLVDELDVAAARAIQYARTLAPDELRAVHFVVDREHADRAVARSGAGSACRRLPARARSTAPTGASPGPAVELVAELTADGDTEVSVLLPRREYTERWHRLLHDRTADADRRGARATCRTPT